MLRILSSPLPSLGFLLMVVVCCQTLYAQTSGGLTDKRNGQQYTWTQLPDGKKWMTENLNYNPETPGSWCFDNDPENCEKFGRLYNWETALKACPADWRLPTKDEFKALFKRYGGIGSLAYGKFMRPDEGSFNGQLSGGFQPKRNWFFSLDEQGFYWTSTPDGPERAYALSLRSDPNGSNVGKQVPENAFSVRCVQD